MSGDMTVAALLDAGADRVAVDSAVGALSLAGWSLKAARTEVNGIGATRVDVIEDAHVFNHDDDHDHAHDDDHVHGHGMSTHHSHRTFRVIKEMLEKAPLAVAVRKRALAVFEKLAEAEGAIHGVAPADVTFHEVGADDSIIDIVAASAAIESINPDRIVASPVPLGRGVGRSQHGEIPLPAPATVRLLRGAATRGIDAAVETVTPTGAAFLATWVDAYGPQPAMTLEREGYGAGHRSLPRPNLLRVILGDSTISESAPREELVVLEANIDDMNPEWFDAAFAHIVAAGAIDVWLTPIIMKKGRPAHLLSALAPLAARAAIERAFFTNTTTLGVRATPVTRTALARETVEVETAFGRVTVKVGRLAGKQLNAAPEYDSARRVAEAAGVPLKEVYAAALAAFTK